MTILKHALRTGGLVGAALLLSAPALAQELAFESGSNGSDGALAFPENAGVIDFDPATDGLDPDHDGVYHFTTITVPTGTTVRLRAGILGQARPVVWLASGPVVIAGEVNLDGEHAGYNTGVAEFSTIPAEPGAGGYEGGAASTEPRPTNPGSGPGGGGALNNRNGGGGGHGTSGRGGQEPGPAYGNKFLLPLTGGSGGGSGGLNTTYGYYGLRAGAGGGALLLASSARITITGVLSDNGGNGSYNAQTRHLRGGGGAGGGLRLIAPQIEGGGLVRARGGVGYGSGDSGGAGRIRLEAFGIDVRAEPTQAVTTGRPAPVFLPANAPRVRVSEIGGVAVAADPKGSFVVPDAVINATTPVSITLLANNVPPGTTVTVRVMPEGAGSGAVLNLVSGPLTGTLAESTATIDAVSLPHGFTRFHVSATWSP